MENIFRFNFFMRIIYTMIKVKISKKLGSKKIKSKETQAQIRERVSAFKVTNNVYFDNKGDRGDKGDQGPQGLTGIQGLTGLVKPVNYVQKVGTQEPNVSVGQLVVTTDPIATIGRPVQVMCYGDAYLYGLCWAQIQLVRDGSGANVALGTVVQVENANGTTNENRQYCIQAIDESPGTGPHTYSLRIYGKEPTRRADFGLEFGPVITARQL